MTKKIVTLITLILLTRIFVSNAYANDYINFENITIDDGISQSTVEVVFQDSQGYIWIGTNDGLNRYNGSDIEIFKVDKSNINNSLVDNCISSITEDKNRNLWVGTLNGLSIINLQDYSIKNYKYVEKNSNKSFNNVQHIFVNDNDDVIVATYDGIYLYNEKYDKFESIYINNNQTLKDTKWIEKDNNGEIWLGADEGLYKLDIKDKKAHIYNESKDKNMKNINGIEALMCDKDNNLWIGTNDDGLYKLNISTGKIIPYNHKKENKNSIPSNYIKSILQDSNGDVWIGTDSGLSRYLDSKKFITYENRSYDLNSLCSNLVFSIIEDSSGLIWVGTYTGISKFDPENNIYLYKNDPLNNNSLSDNIIHGIYEDEEGLLWVGTKDKGLNIFNIKTNKVSHIYEGESENELSSNSVKAIVGSKDTIWVGTKNGVNKINKSDMSIDKITVHNGLASDNIKSLLVDSRGYLWIGSEEGLDILNIKTNQIINLTPIIKKYATEEIDVKEIYEDSDGIYWIGDLISGGLIKFDLDKQIAKLYNLNNDGCNINGIECILENDKDKDYLWIGTISGLYKFNKKTQKYINYTEEDGLANNTIYGILLDEYGNPWMSTNNGICKLNLKTNKFTTITSTDGLQSNEFNSNAYCKLKNGYFVFGGIKGFNLFNPEDIKLSNKSPKVIFDKFYVGEKIYNNINNIKFKHSQNIIRISFFIPEYKKNSNIQYYYKLEGLNTEWIRIKNNEVIFNKLKTGNYKFRVKARTQNGNISEESVVNFSIQPPFYLNNIAILCYIIILILFIYYSLSRVKMLDNLVARRTEDLSIEMKKNEVLYKQVIENERSKNNYFINLSHELRTPLNVICSLEQLISNLNKSEKGLSREKIDYYMEVMRNNTKRLLNLINNIIDTSKIENGKYKLNKEETDIVYLVEETALSMKDAIESSGKELIIDTNVEEKIVNCDKYEIERCIVNLLSNAHKFTPEGGRITVDILDNGNSVIITVEDTGVGIDEEYHEAIFDRFNQVIDENSEEKGGSGLGLTITKHIIKMHGGSIQVTSKKDKGSKFIIVLPVGLNK